MKKIFLTIILSFVIFVFSVRYSETRAATLYWVGADGANASVASNWKTTNPATCGSGDASAIPGASDQMNFDADCDNGAVIDSSFSSTVSVVVLSSGYAGTVTQSNDLTVSSTFTTTGGTWNVSNKALTVTSTFTMNAGSTFYPSSGTTTFSASFTINGGTWDVTVNSGGIVKFDGAGATLTCASGQSFNSVILAGTSSTKTIGANCNFPLGANPTAGFGINVSGTLSGSGILTISSTFTLNSGASLSGFSALTAGTALTVSSGIFDFSNYTTFIVSGNTTLSSGTLTLPNGADLNGALTISSGTFNAPSGTMTLAGALTISGSPTFNANGGIVKFDGTVNNSSTLACNNVTFNLVTFANSTGTKTINSDCNLPLGANPNGLRSVTLNGTLTGSGTLTTVNTLTLNSGAVLSGFNGLVSGASLTISGATIDLSTYNPVIVNNTFTLSSGTFTAPSGVMNVGQSWTNSGGTFNHNNGTVVMTISTTPTITGSNTFYNLTKTPANGIIFIPGTTQTVLGTLNLQGTSGNKLNIRSNTAGLQWYINATGGRVLSNLQVQDSNGIGNIYICSSCVDSGGNTNWSFISGSSIQFSLNYPSGDSHITNTNPTYRWSKASVSNNSAVTKYELYIQPKDSQDNNIETALYIDNISPFIGDNKKYQYNTTYTLYDDGDYLNLTPINYSLPLGKYNFRVVAHDSAGNIAENSYNFWVDSDIFKTSYSNTKTWFPLQINSISGSNQKGVISSFGLPSTNQDQTTLTISTTTPTIKGIAFSNATITLTITDQKTKQTKTYTTKAANSRFTLTPTINSSSYLNISVSLDGKYTQLKTLTINKI